MGILDAGKGSSGPQPNPYTPGRGVLPPYLAGREWERSVLERGLDALAAGGPPGTDIFLYGPRGNGKTVLLEWAVRHARSLKVGVIAESVAGRNAPIALLNRLSLLPAWLSELVGRFEGVTAAGAGVRLRSRGTLPLASMLRRQSYLRPLLLALDEAHMMDPELGLELLNAVQNVQRNNCPVMLVLAGTPDLPRHLNTMGASFWERSTALPIGRLGPYDSADALRIPLEGGGRSIAADALEAVVRESHGYPYFLQLWGEAIWDGSPVATAPISLEDINRVRPRFQMVQRRFYGNRFRELKRAMLVPVAAAVASLFVGRERRAQAEVEHAVGKALAELGRAADEAASIEACERLCDFGYIWPVHDETEEEFEPGIPSLMDYVLIQVRRRAD